MKRGTQLRLIWMWPLLLAPVAAPASWLPFVLPWDDTSSNLTNLSGTLHRPAGLYGWVEATPEGGFAVSGDRIRFYGVNIGAGACFPPKTRAEAVAERLARMGMNVARFHHMEAGWTNGLLAYEAGNSRTFDMERLDRLDFFISRLKAAGVYINLNLLTSRVFTAGDGLPAAIDDLDWKVQHILALFYPPLLELQQEHARKLLDRVNPYTGLRYADDPAIAFVEVNNENGLVHQWYGGDLDALDPAFRTPFRQRWNAWLRARYDTTDAVRTAWGAVDEPLGAELLTNGAFAGGTTGWSLEQHQGAQATLTAGTYGGVAGARLSVQQTGSADWHVQLFNTGFGLQEGQLYTVRFRARADAAFDLRVVASMAHDPWQNLGLNTQVSLAPTWQDFVLTFFASRTDGDARFGFSGLGSRLGSVDLAELSLRPGGVIDPVPAGAAIEADSLPVFTTGGDALPPSRRDWMAFLRDTEEAYWLEMRRFLKEDLGYRGVTWGTTIMNSPPSVQAVYDAIDTHVYWKHPQFPGIQWDPNNWLVENESMVNDPDTGGLGNLLLQRIAGFPHNVTEYQHASPNTYGSEGPLFLGLYGALQDWDGLYLFHYGSDADNWDRGYFDGFFDIDQHPAKLVNAALASLLFRRGDVAPAQTVERVPFSRETELEVLAGSGSAWNVANLSHLDIPPEIGLVRRIEMVLDPEASDLPDGDPVFEETDVLVSDTGELTWDRSDPGAGVVTLDAPKAKVVMGFDAGRAFDLGGVVIDPGATDQGWSTVTVVCVEGTFADPDTGGRGLIATTGNAENTGMAWTDATRTSVGTQWGGAPTLVENVPVAMVLPYAAERVRVWALDTRGDRAAELAVTDQDGSAAFSLGGENGSLWYEFEITAESAPATDGSLRAVDRRTDSVRVAWDPAGGAWAYRLEVSTDGGTTWSPAGVLPAGETGARLGGLDDGRAHWFRVVAENSAGSAAFAPLEASTRETYRDWAARHFPGADPDAPAGPAHWAADPDRDGLCNGLESIFGTAPTGHSRMPAVDVVWEAGVGDALLGWQVAVDPLAELAPRLALEVSPDAASWSRLAPAADHDTALDFSAPAGLSGPVFWRWVLDPGK